MFKETNYHNFLSFFSSRVSVNCLLTSYLEDTSHYIFNLQGNPGSIKLSAGFRGQLGSSKKILQTQHENLGPSLFSKCFQKAKLSKM